MPPKAPRSSAGFPEGAEGEMGEGLPLRMQCSARPCPTVPTQGPRPSSSCCPVTAEQPSLEEQEPFPRVSHMQEAEGLVAEVPASL